MMLNKSRLRPGACIVCAIDTGKDVNHCNENRVKLSLFMMS